MEGITNETNTAQRIYEPEHPYLENTISSMEATFRYGADIVELDIQLTKDGQFAVFHNWALEYRTNKKGATRDYTMSKATLKNAVFSYIAIGWTGYIPTLCKNTEIHIPLKYTPLLWGWPNRFLNRMESVNTRVIVVGGEGEFSEGFDTVEDIKLLPKNYTGGIWTNRIDKIAHLFNDKNVN